MTATRDVTCHEIRPAEGVVVHTPTVGQRPPAHLVVDLDLAVSAAHDTDVVDLEATLNGDLPIAHGRRYSDHGWRLDVPAVLLPPSFELRVTAVGAAGERTDLVTIGGRNDRYRPRTAGPAPLLMHQLGRAGSTMMMRLLAGHPEIGAFDSYPLEHRPALAWMHLLGVIAGEPPAPGGEPFFDETRTTTANPYFSERFLGADLVAAQHRHDLDRLRTLIAEIVEGTYLHDTPGARFFAEKYRIESRHAMVTQQVALATWPGTRQIILVRDPRDLLCSRLSFNRKRSTASFDLDLDDDAESGAPTIVQHLRLAGRQAAAFPDAIVVRYEDLVTRPVATATRIFRELGVRHGFGIVSAAVAHAIEQRSDQHVTTASPAASIGRWRTELPDAAAEYLDRELTDELRRFGYTS